MRFNTDETNHFWWHEKTGIWLTCFETGHPKRIECLPPPPFFPKFSRLHPYMYRMYMSSHVCLYICIYIIYIYLHIDVKIHVYSFQQSFFEICFMHLSKRPYRCIKKRQYIRHRLNFTYNSIDYENAFEKETRRNNTFVFAILRISKRCALDKCKHVYKHDVSEILRKSMSRAKVLELVEWKIYQD